MTVADEIKQLKDLMDNGALTPDEFERSKEALLSKLRSDASSTSNTLTASEKAGKPQSKFLDNFSEMDGRTNRSDYLICIVMFIAAAGLLLSLSIAFQGTTGLESVYLTVLIGFMLLVPTIRRLHDVGMSGFWAVLLFFGIGLLLMFVLLLVPGNKTLNRWGPP